jgi:hypothetical protein
VQHSRIAPSIRLPCCRAHVEGSLPMRETQDYTEIGLCGETARRCEPDTRGTSPPASPPMMKLSGASRRQAHHTVNWPTTFGRLVCQPHLGDRSARAQIRKPCVGVKRSRSQWATNVDGDGSEMSIWFTAFHP